MDRWMGVYVLYGMDGVGYGFVGGWIDGGGLIDGDGGLTMMGPTIIGSTALF